MKIGVIYIKEEQNFVINLLKYNNDKLGYLLNSDCLPAVPIVIDENIGYIPISLFHTNRFLELSIKNKSTVITALLLQYKNKNFSAEEIEKFNIQFEKYEIGLGVPTFEQFCNKWDCIIEENHIFVVGYRGKNDVETIPNEVIEGMKISGIVRSDEHNFFPIKHLTLQENIKLLDDRAFEGCHNLKQVEFLCAVDVSATAFENCYEIEFLENY